VPTAAGEAILVWEDQGFLIKTWLRRESMNDQHAARCARALADDDLLCA